MGFFARQAQAQDEQYSPPFQASDQTTTSLGQTGWTDQADELYREHEQTSPDVDSYVAPLRLGSKSPIRQVGDVSRYASDAFPNMQTIDEPAASHDSGVAEPYSFPGSHVYSQDQHQEQQIPGQRSPIRLVQPSTFDGYDGGYVDGPVSGPVTGPYGGPESIASSRDLGDSESVTFHDVREGTESPVRRTDPTGPIRSVTMEEEESSASPSISISRVLPIAGDSSLLQSGDGLEPVSSDELSSLSVSHTPYPHPDAEAFTPDDYRLSSSNGLAGPRQVPERKPQVVDGASSFENLHRPLSSHMAMNSDAGSLHYSGLQPGASQSQTRKSASFSPSPRASPSMSPSIMSHRMSAPPTAPPVRPMSVLSLGQSYDLTSSALMPHLGEHSANLMPRIKTIELYRKNAKKSKDPAIEFQLAQYMVQTALLKSSGPEDRQPENSSKLSHSRSNSATTNIPMPGSSTTTQGGSERASLASSSNSGENGGPATPSTSGSKEPLDETRLKQSLLKEALGMLRRLSERGFPDAQYLLGDIYSTPAVGGKPDLEKSARYFLMAAKHHHSEAAYRAALCVQEGWGRARDAPRALRLYKAAAVKNQPGALYQLGMAYFHSRLGISDNANNRLIGLKWLTRAVNVANEIYNKAPYELAKIYEVGYHDIVIPDVGYAARLYARSAELNYIPAAAKLGRSYEFGELGCPQDPGLSIHYYTIAALGNDPTAQLSLGAWYMVGAGPQLPVNEDEAFEWVIRAALNGLPKAMYTLGFFYENGIGCDRDIIAGTKWYRRAANAGEERAIAKLQKPGAGEAGTKGKVKTKESDKCLIM